jgi:hypothetical protein
LGERKRREILPLGGKINRGQCHHCDVVLGCRVDALIFGLFKHPESVIRIKPNAWGYNRATLFLGGNK